MRFQALYCQWLILLFLKKVAFVCMRVLVLQSYICVSIWLDGFYQTVGTVAGTHIHCLAFSILTQKLDLYGLMDDCICIFVPYN